jgi:23S rRNA pseudouridine955/2504/2580 synthase
LKTGDEIRVPPMPAAETKPKGQLSDEDVKFIQSLVIYKDKDVIVLNKPAGLAVQGGTKTTRHVDGLSEGIRFGGEKPRLVHRLDKETSGVLVLARNVKIAGLLTKAFESKEARKVYWAVVHGCPAKMQGMIDAPLLKKSGKNGGELVQVDINGQYAKSLYEVIDTTGEFSLLRLMPLTGRTHQLRVHCAHVGCPIVGDEKYGGHFVQNLDKKMLLHAKALRIPLLDGKKLEIEALIPEYMKKSFSFFNFSDKKNKEDFEFRLKGI